MHDTAVLTPQLGDDPMRFLTVSFLVHVFCSVLNTRPCRLSKFPSDQTTPHLLLTRMLEDVSIGSNVSKSRLT
jgi:hypothetical protein